MKNIQLLFLAFFCFQNSALAQEKPSKFRLELSTENIFIKGPRIKSAKKEEVSATGTSFKFSTQVSGFWRLNNRLELGLGLAYAVRDAHTICFCVFCDKLVPIDGVFTRIRSLDLPLELRWKWLKSSKRFDPYVSFGLNTRMPFDFQAGPQYDQTRLDAKATFVGAAFGLGTRIQLFEKWSGIIGLSAEKNDNFKLDKKDLVVKGNSLWLDEWSVSIGLGRNF